MFRILISCTDDKSENENLSPVDQLESTYLNRDTARIILRNELDTVATYSMNLVSNYYYEDTDVKKKLSPGQADTVTIWLSKPFYTFINTSSGNARYIVVPTLDREIAITKEGNENYGSNRYTYDYMDEHLLYLTQGSRLPEDISSVDTILAGLKQDYQTAKETYLSQNEDSTFWVQTFVENEAEIFSYSRALLFANYLKDLQYDTLLISDAVADTIEHFLAEEENYYLPSYINLEENYVKYHSPEDFGSYYDARLHSLYTRYPLEKYKHDEILYFLEMTCKDESVKFEDDSLFNEVFNSLPPDYQDAIECAPARPDSISHEIAEKIREFMKTELVSTSGSSRSIANHSDAKLTLYKYWFVGCAPCVREQKYEKELLEKFPDVDLVYVCHTTTEENWKNYHDRLEVNVTYSLYLPDELREEMKEVNGTRGAPFYTMIDKENNIICHDCPKPSGQKLEDMISNAVK